MWKVYPLTLVNCSENRTGRNNSHECQIIFLLYDPILFGRSVPVPLQLKQMSDIIYSEI